MNMFKFSYSLRNSQCVIIMLIMLLQIQTVYSDCFETKSFCFQCQLLLLVTVIAEALSNEQLVATSGTASASNDNEMVNRINDALVCHSHHAQPSAADMNAATIESLTPKFHAWYKDQVFHTKLENPLGQKDDNENVITSLVAKHQTFQKIWLQYQEHCSCGESGCLSSIQFSKTCVTVTLQDDHLL